MGKKYVHLPLQFERLAGSFPVAWPRKPPLKFQGFFIWIMADKCSSCKNQKTHYGTGEPDDYSAQYCSKSHWEGAPIEEESSEYFTIWDECKDYEPISKTTPAQ